MFFFQQAEMVLQHFGDDVVHAADEDGRGFQRS